MRRVPAFLRTPLLLALLLALHLLCPGVTESARIVMLRIVVAPLGWLRPAPSAGVTPLNAAETAFLQALQDDRRTPFGERGGCLFPVLDLEPEKGWLMVGGGTEDGVRLGSLVSSPQACLGVVDRVTQHLARVRLLSSSEVTLPVEAVPRGRALPGAVPRLLGILEGDGEDAILQHAHLASHFANGDELWTVASGDRASALVGHIVESGVRPRVRLAGRPGSTPWVHVEDADPDPTRGSASLFKTLRLRVGLVGGGRVRGALVAGEGAGDLTAGTAVHEGRRFLGMVVQVAFGAALVARPEDAGRPLEVRVVGEGGEPAAATLEGTGSGFRLRGWQGSRPAPGPVTVVTRGGQELVPPGLLVGSGTWDGSRLELAGQRGWPSHVEVSLFRYPDERVRLRRAGR